MAGGAKVHAIGAGLGRRNVFMAKFFTDPLERGNWGSQEVKQSEWVHGAFLHGHPKELKGTDRSRL